jgi:hypothetical protein
VSALSELQGGKAGYEFITLLQRTIRAVAVSRGFPPPDGHESWGGAALATAVNDFFTSPQTPRRLIDLATLCRTDDALRRRLERTVRNFLADHGRRTPVGRLVVRINDVLGRNPAFERHDAAWALVGRSDEPAQVNLDALAAALQQVEIVVPTSWASGDRHSPDLDADSVVRAATVMLDTASGALTASVMAQAVARRLGLGGAPLSIDAAGFDPAHVPVAIDDTTSGVVLVEVRSREVFARFNDTELFSIGLPHLGVAALGALLGVSGSKAALIRKRAIGILQDELIDDENGQAIADAVLALAQSWTESWMI